MLQGLGIGHLPILHDDLMENNQLFEFVEITPESYIGGDHSLMIDQLTEVRERFLTTCHGLDLSLCSVGDVDHCHLEDCQQVIDLCAPLFFSEHLAFTRSGPLNADIYIPPIYVDSEVHRIADKCRIVTATVGIPFHLENVPDFMFGRTGMGEGEFFDRLNRESGCEVVLNLDSIVISASAQNCDPIDLIRTYPFDRIAGLTVVPESCMNPVIQTMCGGFDLQMFELLEFCLKETSARSVLIQTRYASNTAENLMGPIKRIRQLLDEACA